MSNHGREDRVLFLENYMKPCMRRFLAVQTSKLFIKKMFHCFSISLK